MPSAGGVLHRGVADDHRGPIHRDPARGMATLPPRSAQRLVERLGQPGHVGQQPGQARPTTPHPSALTVIFGRAPALFTS